MSSLISIKVKYGIAMLLAMGVFSPAYADDTAVLSVESQIQEAPVTVKEKGKPQPSVAPVPVKVIYVRENQPVQIMDSHGRLIQVIYVRKTK